MSVESGRREYERQHQPVKPKTLDQVRGSKRGTVAFGELTYLAEKGDQEARGVVRNAVEFEGGSEPVLPDNMGPNAA